MKTGQDAANRKIPDDGSIIRDSAILSSRPNWPAPRVDAADPLRGIASPPFLCLLREALQIPIAVVAPALNALVLTVSGAFRSMQAGPVEPSLFALLQCNALVALSGHPPNHPEEPGIQRRTTRPRAFPSSNSDLHARPPFRNRYRHGWAFLSSSSSWAAASFFRSSVASAAAS